MTGDIRATVSLKRRLMIQLLIVLAVLSLVLYGTVRLVAERAAEQTQDNILWASATAMAEELSASGPDILIDIPYAALSMLGTVSEDRVFYHILADGQTITGYEDLPAPDPISITGDPVSMTTSYRGEDVRIVALTRALLVEDAVVPVTVLVAQTRLGQAVITAQIANTAAALGVGFFAVAAVLSWFAAQSALRPLTAVTEAVLRRGPSDLRPMRSEAPLELAPLLTALNTFMDRLRGALSRTEEFIAEAAHRVRTPLATVRAQTEVALRHAETPENREALRRMIRAVDESSRSAGQLLDHAMVRFRSDQLVTEHVDLCTLVRDTHRGLAPTAEMKDITFHVDCVQSAVISGDPILLGGALRNLVDNAIKYSEAETEIELIVLREAGLAKIHVMDRGRGLGGYSQEVLTRRFNRGGNASDIVGSGLGLTIVAEVAEAHGGALHLFQRKGGGTCATLSLPLV